MEPKNPLFKPTRSQSMAKSREDILASFAEKRRRILIEGSKHMWYLVFIDCFFELLADNPDTLQIDDLKLALEKRLPATSELMHADIKEALALLAQERSKKTA
jgi:hypothetical protein